MGDRTADRLSDLHVDGVSGVQLEPSERLWLVTVDVEAFDLKRAGLFAGALRHWGARASDANMRFVVFLSVEHAIRLRAASRTAYDELLGELSSLVAAGGEVHPHNHCLFDPQTARRPGEYDSLPDVVDGYQGRASVFYDVAYRNRHSWSEWLSELLPAYRQVLTEGALPVPPWLAFRAGGWDTGSSAADKVAYVHGLAANGFSYDSSATTVASEPRLPFASNVFALSPGLVEVAPCWSMDCGRSLLSPLSAGRLSRLAAQRRLWSDRTARGVFVTVLHLDHLFHRRRRAFVVQDAELVRTRIDRCLRELRALGRTLSLTSGVFADVQLGLYGPTT